MVNGGGSVSGSVSRMAMPMPVGYRAIPLVCMLLAISNTAHSQTLAPTASPTPNATEELMWYEGGYVGKVCSGTDVSECPAGQSCYAPTALARAELGGYEDVDDDEVSGDVTFRCACWGYYGYQGHDNESGRCEPSETSYVVTVAYGLVALFAMVTCGFFWFTVSQLAVRWGAKRLKMNPAIVCLLLGAGGSFPMFLTVSGFAYSPLGLDPEMRFERYGWKGYGIGIMAFLGIPCLLNVVNLWIDVAMGAMNKGGTKKQRAAMAKKVSCVVYTATAISSSVVIVLLLADMISYVLSFLIFMAVLMGFIYAYGGYMLSKALSQGMDHGPESSKGGCCAKSEAAKTDMNCYMVTKTANNIAFSMAGAVLGALGYLVVAVRPNAPGLPLANVVPSCAIAFTLGSFNSAFLVTLLYIRYGLRKVLDLDFPDAAETGDHNHNDHNHGRDAKGGPGGSDKLVTSLQRNEHQRAPPQRSTLKGFAR
eukprot:CAMPEP_0182563316 /NCGR_PEP_ID=MMETSP1324-20130603/5483_1 /TAXON_ID=236786 /ORGANISM="Florenciella sp., Strain RCC1587" /LENGTH=478 /DNA_ID=CAMNT_0024776481 /DNA_START=102 /DNA_END=1537 /DNA_ORIENTATION=+